MSLLGIGTALPSAELAQSALAEAAAEFCADTAEQRRLLPKLYQRSTVRSRASVLGGNGNGSPVTDDQALAHVNAFYRDRTASTDRGPSVAQRMAEYDRHALPLAARACRAALANAQVDPGDIGQLVIVSCTGFSAPGLDIKLIEALGLTASVGRTMVGFMGCHGALNGLRVAAALARSDPGATVLMCCVELCTLHFQYGWDPQQIVANALFADGAAAIVGRAEAERSGARPARVIDHGSVLIPDSRDDMTWTIADHGFEMTLSARVPDLIRRHLRPWLTDWLGGHRLMIDDVPNWAVHPGGPRVISAVDEALQLPPGACDLSRQVLARHGNMSSPTVLFILDELIRAGPTRGARGPCVVVAFGPGLIAEAALIELGA